MESVIGMSGRSNYLFISAFYKKMNISETEICSVFFFFPGGIILLKLHYSFFLDINVLARLGESWLKTLQHKSKSI